MRARACAFVDSKRRFRTNGSTRTVTIYRRRWNELVLSAGRGGQANESNESGNRERCIMHVSDIGRLRFWINVSFATVLLDRPIPTAFKHVPFFYPSSVANVRSYYYIRVIRKLD